MPYWIEADWTHRIARCRFQGQLIDEELQECYRIASEIAAQEDPLAGIVDLSAITSLKVSPGAILGLANSPPIMPNPDRVRIIIAEPLHIYGMARMFGLAGQYLRPNLHVVRRTEHAWAILGVQNPQFKAYKR